MLTNFDIERIAHKLDLPIIGVYCKDELINIERKVGSYYINHMSSIDGNGSHWVLAKIYSDDERYNDSSDDDSVECVCNAIYFDPFGLGMPKEISAFLKPFNPVYCNNRQIQSTITSQCGWYCLACDYVLEKKKHSKTMLEDYEKFIEIWSDDTKKNLTKLKALFKPL